MEGKHMAEAVSPVSQEHGQQCCEHRGQANCELVMCATPVFQAKSPTLSTVNRILALRLLAHLLASWSRVP